MTEWIITSSALILIVLALRGLLKGKISLRLQYGLWALVLVRLLFPFSITESTMSLGNVAEDIRLQPIVQRTDTAVRQYESAYDEIVSRYEELGITVTPAQTRQEAQDRIYSDTYNTMVDSYAQEGVEVPEPQLQQEARQQAESISLIAMITEALPTIWYAGMALTGTVLLASNLYFYWRLRKSRVLLDMPEIPLRVYHTDYVATPCLFGLVRPGIYLTDEVVRDTQMRNHVLTHELTHHRHRDHIWSILRGMCLMLHWYNPLVWAAAMLSKRDAELACDESTIRTLGEKERMAYGRTLIGMTCVRHDPKSLFLTATTMIGSKKTLKERISLIAKKPKTAIVTLIACILVVSLAVGCTFTGANVTGPERNQVWEKVLTAVEEYNSRGYYQVTYDMEYDFSGHDLDHTVTREYLQHGSNEYMNIAIRNEQTEFVLRYEGTMYWREAGGSWQTGPESDRATDLALEVPTGENLVLSWTESGDGLVVVCDYSYSGYTDYANLDPTVTFHIDIEGKLTKYVCHYGFDTEISYDYILTQTVTIQDPTEATVLLYLDQAYEEVAEALGLNSDDTTPLPTVSDTVQPLPEDYTLEDLVSSYDEYHAWSDDMGNEFDAPFSMPLIYPFSEDAIAAQQEISNYFLSLLEQNRDRMASNQAPAYLSVLYDDNLNGDLLSILTFERTYPHTTNYYKVFNFDLDTGALLSNAEMAARYLPELSYPEYLMALTQFREEDYRRNASEMTGDPPESFLDTELDHDTVAMSGAKLYLDYHGSLQIAYASSTPAGAGYYQATAPFSPEDLDWTPPTREEAYAWFLTIQTDGAYTASYIPMLYDALYAAPAEFVENLAKLPQADRDEVLMLMEWETEFYGPNKLPQTVSDLEAVTEFSEVEKAIVARLREFADSLS